jgi:hypothetical protein
VAQTFSGGPLTTGCRTGTLYPETATVAGRPAAAFRGLQASVSPTPCVADFGAAFANGPQSCTLQTGISRHRQGTGSLRRPRSTPPTRAYFFFLAATLRLAGAFFFAAVFAFVAFFTMLPS